MNAALIVDGYNVINAWAELIKLKDQSLEHARDKLVEMLAGYGAYKGYRVTVVYDAHSAAGLTAVENKVSGVDVIYTADGQTADSYIEKMVYLLVRQRETVYVVTSDGAEQMAILGSGAYRISTRELRRDVLECTKMQEQTYAESVLTYRRNEVGSRIDIDIMRKLDEMRRRR